MCVCVCICWCVLVTRCRNRGSTWNGAVRQSKPPPHHSSSTPPPCVLLLNISTSERWRGASRCCCRCCWRFANALQLRAIHGVTGMLSNMRYQFIRGKRAYFVTEVTKCFMLFYMPEGDHQPFYSKESQRPFATWCLAHTARRGYIIDRRLIVNGNNKLHESFSFISRLRLWTAPVCFLKSLGRYLSGSLSSASGHWVWPLSQLSCVTCVGVNEYVFPEGNILFYGDVMDQLLP